jgi:hypothetical protein
MTAGFGVFSPLFEASADYLVLLHLDMPEAKRVVTKVVERCHLSSACHEEVGNLFDHSDWRPHLVGAVALSALPYVQESSGKLWEAIDRRSWVTPQLAVAAFIRDPAFADQAGARVRSRSSCAKTAASLAYLAGRLSFRPDWLDTELLKADLIGLLAKDVDGSAEIAEHWLTRLKELLDQR